MKRSRKQVHTLGNVKQRRILARRERRERIAERREFDSLSRSWDRAAKRAEIEPAQNRDAIDQTARGTPSGRKSERSFKSPGSFRAG